MVCGVRWLCELGGGGVWRVRWCVWVRWCVGLDVCGRLGGVWVRWCGVRWCGVRWCGVPVLACLCFMEWCLIQATHRGKAGRR